MSTNHTYPGVYIEEIPSGVRTIAGVPTSITAFIGRAFCGPVNKPVTINSYRDFERIFGGLWSDSSMSYAIRDFFLNGGSQAIVVRLFHADLNSPQPIKTKIAVGGLNLVAAEEGSWGANLRATVDQDVSQEYADKIGLDKDVLFNLTIKEDILYGTIEQFLNLTVVDSQRRIDKVLEAESQLVRWNGACPSSALTVNPGSDKVTETEYNLDAVRKTGNQNDIARAEAAVEAAKKDLVTSDGLALTYKDDFCSDEAEIAKNGLYALENVDLFNILCLPPPTTDGDVELELVAEACVYCEKRRAFFIVDPPIAWKDKESAKNGIARYVGTNSKNAALFFPRLKQYNPRHKGQLESFVPSGAVAGVFARTDIQRGVWKAPAGLDATLVGFHELSLSLTDSENDELNPLGINCLRIMPAAGSVVWGARTLQGDDRLASEWKYIPIRRLALHIEESLFRGTKWVVFEPNHEPLWSQIRLNVGSFMHNLFRQGAFQGKMPQEAYFVKCDKETTTQNDINLGIVNIIVGFAPLKPAEFVIIKIQQLAGQMSE